MNAYDTKETGTSLLPDSVSVEYGSSVTNINDIPKYEMQCTRLARKEFRKLKKKQRKKALRIEAAKILEQNQEHTHSEATEATKAEEIKLNVERILWEARERHIDQVNAEKRRKQEEEERKKKIIQENWEKTVKNIKLHKPNITTIVNDANSESNSSSAQMSSSISTITTTSFQEIMPLESDYGTEKVVYPESYLDIHMPSYIFNYCNIYIYMRKHLKDQHIFYYFIFNIL
ncbi:hypothetical protein F8M41_019129 [Gigaspora margarita]|uniref:Uncharacterized protein n=1 Tax=Gigaspora margarita TaxID=4874 RepID=A0A8H4AKF3_GIGMA|nr:hypothetical protein F8M41_019129 [Gigaspora margarita]